MEHDLSLPHQAPELGQYEDFVWDYAAFAVYTLLGDKVPPQDVATALEKQWLDQGNEDHLARPAPTAEFNTLHEVLQAHVALDKVMRERSHSERSDGNTVGKLEWWPTAFVVVTQEDWRTKPNGLLFVFEDEEKDYEMDKFFFKLEDAYMMLSSLSFEELAQSKVIYGQDA
jgi:hypothetical protein